MPSAGDKVRASDILTRKGCRLRRVANQSINTATTTAISWDTEDEDQGGFIAVTSTTVTIPTGLGGIYDLTFVPQPQAGISGRAFCEVIITTSLTGYPAEFRVFMDSSNEDRAFAALSGIPLAAADTFVCNVFHGTGAAVNYRGWMSCYRVGI